MKTWKPYVNFYHLNQEQFKDVKQALDLMSGRMFCGEVHSLWSILTWEQHEGMMIQRFNLRNQNLALFLGHSRDWAATHF